MNQAEELKNIENSPDQSIDMSAEELRKAMGSRLTDAQKNRDKLITEKRVQAAEEVINNAESSPTGRIDIPIEQMRAARNKSKQPPKKSLFQRLKFWDE